MTGSSRMVGVAPFMGELVMIRLMDTPPILPTPLFNIPTGMRLIRSWFMVKLVMTLSLVVKMQTRFMGVRVTTSFMASRAMTKFMVKTVTIKFGQTMVTIP